MGVHPLLVHNHTCSRTLQQNFFLNVSSLFCYTILSDTPREGAKERETMNRIDPHWHAFYVTFYTVRSAISHPADACTYATTHTRHTCPTCLMPNLHGSTEEEGHSASAVSSPALSAHIHTRESGNISPLMMPLFRVLPADEEEVYRKYLRGSHTRC